VLQATVDRQLSRTHLLAVCLGVLPDRWQRPLLLTRAVREASQRVLAQVWPQRIHHG
jgi:hypothetical protein